MTWTRWLIFVTLTVSVANGSQLELNGDGSCASYGCGVLPCDFTGVDACATFTGGVALPMGAILDLTPFGGVLTIMGELRFNGDTVHSIDGGATRTVGLPSLRSVGSLTISAYSTAGTVFSFPELVNITDTFSVQNVHGLPLGGFPKLTRAATVLIESSSFTAWSLSFQSIDVLSFDSISNPPPLSVFQQVTTLDELRLLSLIAPWNDVSMFASLTSLRKLVLKDPCRSDYTNCHGVDYTALIPALATVRDLEVDWTWAPASDHVDWTPFHAITSLDTLRYAGSHLYYGAVDFQASWELDEVGTLSFAPFTQMYADDVSFNIKKINHLIIDELSTNGGSATFHFPALTTLGDAVIKGYQNYPASASFPVLLTAGNMQLQQLDDITCDELLSAGDIIVQQALWGNGEPMVAKFPKLKNATAIEIQNLDYAQGLEVDFSKLETVQRLIIKDNSLPFVGAHAGFLPQFPELLSVTEELVISGNIQATDPMVYTNAYGCPKLTHAVVKQPEALRNPQFCFKSEFIFARDIGVFTGHVNDTNDYQFSSDPAAYPPLGSGCVCPIGTRKTAPEDGLCILCPVDTRTTSEGAATCAACQTGGSTAGVRGFSSVLCTCTFATQYPSGMGTPSCVVPSPDTISQLGCNTVIGPTGPTGPTGLQGLPGAQGFNGSQGLQGVQGTPGIQGPMGAQGAQGAQGVEGVSTTERLDRHEHNITDLLNEIRQLKELIRGIDTRCIANSTYTASAVSMHTASIAPKATMANCPVQPQAVPVVPTPDVLPPPPKGTLRLVLTFTVPMTPAAVAQLFDEMALALGVPRDRLVLVAIIPATGDAPPQYVVDIRDSSVDYTAVENAAKAFPVLSKVNRWQQAVNTTESAFNWIPLWCILALVGYGVIAVFLLQMRKRQVRDKVVAMSDTGSYTAFASGPAISVPACVADLKNNLAWLSPFTGDLSSRYTSAQRLLVFVCSAASALPVTAVFYMSQTSEPSIVAPLLLGGIVSCVVALALGWCFSTQRHFAAFVLTIVLLFIITIGSFVAVMLQGQEFADNGVTLKGINNRWVLAWALSVLLSALVLEPLSLLLAGAIKRAMMTERNEAKKYTVQNDTPNAAGSVDTVTVVHVTRA